ncbi:hypothetical protein CRENBAI_003313 [Crenichthys baileyi]|uniref:Uncharacterized protein n=1 Tax=Crenichthys baileyi TaxID=28760 RepID=A0AAV9R4W4_9TELE
MVSSLQSSTLKSFSQGPPCILASFSVVEIQHPAGHHGYSIVTATAGLLGPCTADFVDLQGSFSAAVELHARFSMGVSMHCHRLLAFLLDVLLDLLFCVFWFLRSFGGPLCLPVLVRAGDPTRSSSKLCKYRMMLISNGCNTSDNKTPCADSEVLLNHISCPC